MSATRCITIRGDGDGGNDDDYTASLPMNYKALLFFSGCLCVFFCFIHRWLPMGFFFSVAHSVRLSFRDVFNATHRKIPLTSQAIHEQIHSFIHAHTFLPLELKVEIKFKCKRSCRECDGDDEEEEWEKLVAWTCNIMRPTYTLRRIQITRFQFHVRNYM